MTIEIRQLVIRAVVEEKREQASPAAASRGRATRELARRGAPESQVHAVDREALIAECTRQVLRELRKGRER